MINKKWDIVLKDEMKKDYFRELGIFVKSEQKHKIIYPEYKNIFNALRYTDYDEVKVATTYEQGSGDESLSFYAYLCQSAGFADATDAFNKAFN